ncbi:DUF4148 domain-containing protein [Paraburkholderia dinghuensis]|uniref:DUF4148 domain-containing protein n=1 Tax=Paraburkholderia dinghuensis TaxID=2305225 RepID=A0A3N6MS50_9BURK|nr:DUF4148 domain-containing protein [Paraburkholderia dinghuensis]RQH06489.1 DUF4148 domain-containing protein [Paraburkholderia dinghuensis]
MKSLVKAVALAVVLVAPAVSFAQAQPGNGPVTRAQVREELVQLEKAGYRPNVNEQNYPDNIQAAEARVHAQDGGQASGYGPATSGTTQAGGPVTSYSAPMSVYKGGH